MYSKKKQSIDEEADEAHCRYVETDPTGRYGRVRCYLVFTNT